MTSPPVNDLELALVAAQEKLRALGFTTEPFPNDESRRRDVLSNAKEMSHNIGILEATILMAISFEQDALSNPHFDKISEPVLTWPKLQLGHPEIGAFWKADDVKAIVDTFLDLWRAILELHKAHIQPPAVVTQIIEGVRSLLLNRAAQATPAMNNEAVITPAQEERIATYATRQYALIVYRKFLAVMRALKNGFDGVAGRLDAEIAQSKAAEVAATVIDELVTLDQIAPLVGQSKRTLERYLKQGLIPEPDYRGGNGKAHKWLWRNVRASLESVAGRELPEKFPGSRIV